MGLVLSKGQPCKASLLCWDGRDVGQNPPKVELSHWWRGTGLVWDNVVADTVGGLLPILTKLQMPEYIIYIHLYNDQGMERRHSGQGQVGGLLPNSSLQMMPILQGKVKIGK